MLSALGHRGLGHLDLGASTSSPADPAPLPRPGDDRAGDPRRPAAGHDRDGRPPGAAGVPRPAVGAAATGVRARPHVPLGPQHARAGWCGSGSRWCCSRRSTRRCCCSRSFAVPTVVTASTPAGGRAAGPGARRGPRAAGRPPLHDRDHRRAGKEVRVTGIGADLVADRRARVGALVRTRSRAPAGARQPGTPPPGRSSGSGSRSRSWFVAVAARQLAPAWCCCS